MKKILSDLESENIEITDAANASERRFLESLFEIKVRNGSRTSWAGFHLGYHQ